MTHVTYWTPPPHHLPRLSSDAAPAIDAGYPKRVQLKETNNNKLAAPTRAPVVKDLTAQNTLNRASLD